VGPAPPNPGRGRRRFALTASTGGWFARRKAPDGPRYLERFRILEPPILTETKIRIYRGDVAGALRYAYPLVLEDVEKAYAVKFPPEWTHEEILRTGIPPGAGPVVELLPRLYRLYAPARYSDGAPLPPEAGTEAIEILRSLYSVAPMWRLYAWHRPSGLGRLFPPRAPSPPVEAVDAASVGPEAEAPVAEPPATAEVP
jgi:hypothetical protein